MFEFTITDDDGEETTFVADSRDVVRWEHTSESDERYPDLVLTRSRSLSRCYRLAHIAAKRQQLIGCSLSDFEKRYQLDYKIQEKPRPTNAEVSPETS